MIFLCKKIIEAIKYFNNTSLIDDSSDNNLFIEHLKNSFLSFNTILIKPIYILF